MCESYSHLPVLLTVQEVAQALHCSPSYIRSQILSGKLVAAKVANAHLISPSDLDIFIEACKCQKPIVAPTLSTGARRRGAGTSAGTNQAAPDIAAQALLTLRKRQADLRKREADLRNSSKGESRDGTLQDEGGRGVRLRKTEL